MAGVREQFCTELPESEQDLRAEVVVLRARVSQLEAANAELEHRCRLKRAALAAIRGAVNVVLPDPPHLS